MAVESVSQMPQSNVALSLRRGSRADADAVHALVESNLDAGHLLPRTLEELKAHATRFLVIEDLGRVVACAELAPLSRLMAEVRSLIVASSHRHRGLGTSLLEALKEWARREGYETLCAFTHEPGVFVRLGFSMVPHQWIPEKISTDCVACPKFRTCGQFAMALPLADGKHVGTIGRVRSSTLPPSAQAAAEPPTGVVVVRR